MHIPSFSHLLPLGLFLFVPSATASAQAPCNTPASIVQGAECNLVAISGAVLLPCVAPIGFHALPLGTQLLISYVPDGCISFCQQGADANIQCAQVVGGSHTALCTGQSVSIGAPAEPGRLYHWTPSIYLSCDTCAVVTAHPPSNAIYIRTETNLACQTCPPTLTFYDMIVSPCSGVEETPASDVQVSPVPTSGSVRVTGMEFDRFQVFDALGRLQASGTANTDQTIDFAPLPAGTYWLYLASERGGIVRKIVKDN